MDNLMEQNEPLVKFVLNRYYQSWDDDMYQQGLIGLWQAIEKYDDSKGKFSTFAIRCIKNNINKIFRANNCQMRQAELYYLDDIIDDENDNSKYKFVGGIYDTEQESIYNLSLQEIISIVEHMPDKARQIWRLVLDGKTQREIADRLKCTTQNVSFVINKYKPKIMEVIC